jgi:hypothetical protein
MDEVKKQALEGLIQKRKADRMDKFNQDIGSLGNQPVEVMDDTLQKDVMEVTSPEAREAKVDAYRKARRAAKGLPAEVAEEVLDYNQLRRQMMKAGRRGLKSVPVLGSLVGLAGAEDASAALPILGDAESAGQSKEADLDFLGSARGMQDYNQSQARQDKLRRLAELKK